MEMNGDVYNCDHFVYPQYKLGNINDTPLRQMNNSAQNQQFGLDKAARWRRNAIPARGNSPVMAVALNTAFAFGLRTDEAKLSLCRLSVLFLSYRANDESDENPLRK